MEDLNVSHTAVTLNGLLLLKDLPKLAAITIPETLTDKDVAILLARLPNVQIAK